METADYNRDSRRNRELLSNPKLATKTKDVAWLKDRVRRRASPLLQVAFESCRKASESSQIGPESVQIISKGDG